MLWYLIYSHNQGSMWAVNKMRSGEDNGDGLPD